MLRWSRTTATLLQRSVVRNRQVIFAADADYQFFCDAIAVAAIGQHSRIGYIGRGGDHRVNHVVLGIHTHVGLHAEVPLLGPSWSGCMSASRLLSVFLVEEGTLMIVASTTVAAADLDAAGFQLAVYSLFRRLVRRSRS